MAKVWSDYRHRTSAWGKGYSTEESGALIHKRCTELGVQRVWARKMAVDMASRRVMEKSGLTLVRGFDLSWDELSRARDMGRSSMRCARRTDTGPVASPDVLVRNATDDDLEAVVHVKVRRLDRHLQPAHRSRKSVACLSNRPRSSWWPSSPSRT